MMRRGLIGGVLSLLAILMMAPAEARAQAPSTQSGARAERTFWYFYRVKWGYQDEFQELFKRNHYPILKAQIGGRIKSVKVYVPTFHGDGRADWTFAVEITWRDIDAFFDDSGQEALIKRLYPDAAKFAKEEQRRFEILDAHWDSALNELTMP